MVEFLEPRGQSRGSRIELSSLEAAVARDIFMSFLRGGKAPTLAQTSEAVGRPTREICRILDSLRRKDLVVLDDNSDEIVAIYPVSFRPTEHEVVIKNGVRLFAMCAVDALSVPGMFAIDVTIHSRCEWCREKLTVKIEDGQVIFQSHRGIQVWSPTHWAFPAATSCCPFVNFFCCENHVRQWETESPKLKQGGEASSLEEVYADARDYWNGYGEALGLR